MGYIFIIFFVIIVFVIYNFDKIVERIQVKFTERKIKEEMGDLKIKETPTKILVNKIKCNKCGDIIESVHRHDFKFCKCKRVAVDGGKEYLRRMFTNMDDFTDLSESVKDDKNIL